MTCEPILDEAGRVVGIVCSAPWGIGTYRIPEEFREQGYGDTGYGFMKTDNPHDFWPDHESCTEAEIAAHKEACDVWDAAQAKEPKP